MGGLVYDNLAFGPDGTLYGCLEGSRVVGVEVQRRFWLVRDARP